MKKLSVLITLVLAGFVLGGCGIKGPLQPPLTSAVTTPPPAQTMDG